MGTSSTRLKTALFGYLGQQAGINVREYVAARVYPDFAPENAAFPHIVFTQIQGGEIQTLTEVSELTRETFQFDVYSQDADECDIVAQAVRLDLQRWRGTFSNIGVRNAFMTRMGDGYAGPSDGTDLPQYRITLEFEIWYVRDRTV